MLECAVGVKELPYRLGVITTQAIRLSSTLVVFKGNRTDLLKIVVVVHWFHYYRYLLSLVDMYCDRSLIDHGIDETR